MILICTVPPSFSASLPTSKQTKKEDARVDYLCEAVGKPAPNITWTFKGKNLTDNPAFDISTSFHSPSPFNKLWTTQSSLTINKLTWRQGGIFYCLAFNAAGKQIQSTELEVACKYNAGKAIGIHDRNIVSLLRCRSKCLIAHLNLQPSSSFVETLHSPLNVKVSSCGRIFS